MTESLLHKRRLSLNLSYTREGSAWISPTQEKAQLESLLHKRKLRLNLCYTGEGSDWISPTQENAQTDSLLHKRRLRLNLCYTRAVSDWISPTQEMSQTESLLHRRRLRLNLCYTREVLDWIWNNQEKAEAESKTTKQETQVECEYIQINLSLLVSNQLGRLCRLNLHQIRVGKESMNVDEFRERQLKVTNLKGSNRVQKNGHYINWSKNGYNFPFGEVTVFKGLTYSQITLCGYCHQVPDYKQTKTCAETKQLKEKAFGWGNRFIFWYCTEKYSERHSVIFEIIF